VIYAGKEALQPFSATFPGHVEIFKRAVILNTDFLLLNYRGAFFGKTGPFGADFGLFQKNAEMRGRRNKPQPHVF